MRTPSTNHLTSLQKALLDADKPDPQAEFFLKFEPWDVGARPQEILDLALQDGVDLQADEFVRHAGTDPHLYQTGYLLSQARLRVNLGGTQIGKSISDMIENIMMLSHEIPYSLRVEAGVDTGVKRTINESNIRRFGRRDSRTGSFIDCNWKAERAMQWEEWDCGNVTGVGIYPKEKLAPEGSTIWIGTWNKALDEYWWPRFKGSEQIIPAYLIDTSQANAGYNSTDHVVFLARNCRISAITYETGYDRFEAVKVHKITLDEEPGDRRIFDGADTHCKYITLNMTPYRGITWSREIIFPSRRSKENKVFHATQFDSPYQDNSEVEERRTRMKPWVRSARIWGVHAEIRGEPFFDRSKITGWINKFNRGYQMARFIPQAEYYGIKPVTQFEVPIKCLLDTKCKIENVKDDDLIGTWRVYEGVMPNMPYFMCVDPAEGAETPEAVGDICAAIIARPPFANMEHVGSDVDLKMIRPKIVATLRSTAPTATFSRHCLHALMYFNKAMLVAETRRGAANATFLSHTTDWPRWYKHTSIQDSTGAPRQHKGFDTNSATRQSLFEYADDWFNVFGEDDYPEIPDYAILKEAAAAVTEVSKSGISRCDHTSDGTLDSMVCFGVMCYVFKHALNQVMYQVEKDDVAQPYQKIMNLVGLNAESSPRTSAVIIPSTR